MTRIDITNAQGITVTVHDDLVAPLDEAAERTFTGPFILDWIRYTLNSGEFAEELRIVNSTATMNVSHAERVSRALLTVAARDFHGDL